MYIKIDLLKLLPKTINKYRRKQIFADKNVYLLSI